MVVLIVAMICYAFLPFDNFWAKFAARIALLPLIVGVSYEVIRFAAKRQGGLMAWLTRPGLWLQRVTTQPPSTSRPTWRSMLSTTPCSSKKRRAAS